MAATYTVTSGSPTPWMDLTGLTESFTLNGKNISAGTILLETSHDITSSKADAVTIQSFSADFAKVITKPMPRYLRLRATSGQWVVGFGRSADLKGNFVDVPVQGASSTPSGSF